MTDSLRQITSVCGVCFITRDARMSRMYKSEKEPTEKHTCRGCGSEYKYTEIIEVINSIRDHEGFK